MMDARASVHLLLLLLVNIGGVAVARGQFYASKTGVHYPAMIVGKWEGDESHSVRTVAHMKWIDSRTGKEESSVSEQPWRYCKMEGSIRYVIDMKATKSKGARGIVKGRMRLVFGGKRVDNFTNFKGANVKVDCDAEEPYATFDEVVCEYEDDVASDQGVMIKEGEEITFSFRKKPRPGGECRGLREGAWEDLGITEGRPGAGLIHYKTHDLLDWTGAYTFRSVRVD